MKIEFNQKPLTDFWIGLRSEYPALTNRAVKTLKPFATTYLCESGFSALTSMKTKPQTVCGKWFKTETLQYNPTLQSYVPPFKHNLINLWWVNHNLMNKWGLICKVVKSKMTDLLFVPWSCKSSLTRPMSRVVTKSHLLNIRMSVSCSVSGSLTTMAINTIWEYADPGDRGGTQLEIEWLKGYRTIKSLGTTALHSATMNAATN